MISRRVIYPAAESINLWGKSAVLGWNSQTCVFFSSFFLFLFLDMIITGLTTLYDSPVLAGPWVYIEDKTNSQKLRYASTRSQQSRGSMDGQGSWKEYKKGRKETWISSMTLIGRWPFHRCSTTPDRPALSYIYISFLCCCYWLASSILYISFLVPWTLVCALAFIAHFSLSLSRPIYSNLNRVPGPADHMRPLSS